MEIGVQMLISPRTKALFTNQKRGSPCFLFPQFLWEISSQAKMITRKLTMVSWSWYLTSCVLPPIQCTYVTRWWQRLRKSYAFSCRSTISNNSEIPGRHTRAIWVSRQWSAMCSSALSFLLSKLPLVWSLREVSFSLSKPNTDCCVHAHWHLFPLVGNNFCLFLSAKASFKIMWSKYFKRRHNIGPSNTFNKKLLQRAWLASAG